MFIKPNEDADVLIVQTAIVLSRENVSVFSGDIVVLVLQTALYQFNKETYFFKLGKSSTERQIYSSESFLLDIPSCQEHILFYMHLQDRIQHQPSLI